MKAIQKKFTISSFVVSFLVILIAAFAFPTQHLSAEPAPADDPCAGIANPDAAARCKNQNTSATNEQTDEAPQYDPTRNCAEGANNWCGFVDKWVNPAINFLGAAFGLIIVISVVAAGIQYSSAGGDPGKVNAARKRIFNSVLALVAFILTWAFLQFIVPGGIF